MSGPLEVRLHDEVVATLTSSRGQLRLTHTPRALERYELNTPMLSVAMPVSTQRYTHRVVHPFFDGLLPEGDQRQMLAYDFSLSETDTFGLLAEIGRDCAGALVISPASPPSEAGAGIVATEPIDDAGVARRIADLRTNPLGVDGRVRVSLAGVQGKLLLTRLREGWGLPVDGTPSTHILKPAGALTGMVGNEAFCLALARTVGLDAAPVSVEEYGGRPVLVVERYDRRVGDAGAILRVHQEDFCQALSLATRDKYEEHGGPSLERVAAVLKTWRAPDGDLERLLEIVTFSVAVGNADLHGKNLSLLHDEWGGVRLAPVYDVMSTLIYEGVSRRAGLFVDGVEDLHAIGVDDLVREAARWGLGSARAREVVTGLLEAVRREAPGVGAAWSPLPSGLVELVGERAEALLAGAGGHGP